MLRKLQEFVHLSEHLLNTTSNYAAVYGKEKSVADIWISFKETYNNSLTTLPDRRMWHALSCILSSNHQIDGAKTG